MIIVWILLAAVGGALVVILVAWFRRGKKQRVEDSDTSSTIETSSSPKESGKGPAMVEEQPAAKDVDIAVGVNQLKLSNIRSFTKFDLKLAGPSGPPNAGQWALILGDNGVGKSTILRALVLALADPDVSTAVLQTQKSPAPLIRRGSDEGNIVLTVNGDLDYAVKLISGSGC